jgi:hypothetical protein
MIAFAPLALASSLVAAPPSPSPSPSAPPDAKAIVDRAIEARGGEDALKRATVLEWRGRATSYADHGEPVAVEGRWIVEPPDRGVILTSEAGKGRDYSRRLVLLGSEGWTEEGGERKALPPDILASERDQFYVASLLRVLPLRDPDVTLTATGPRSLRVEKEGRPTVDLVFDGTGWLDRMRARVADPDGETVTEEITFTGEVVARGVRWPRRINVSRNGAPFVDLEIVEFRVAAPADLTREAERGARD